MRIRTQARYHLPLLPSSRYPGQPRSTLTIKGEHNGESQQETESAGTARGERASGCATAGPRRSSYGQGCPSSQHAASARSASRERVRSGWRNVVQACSHGRESSSRHHGGAAQEVRRKPQRCDARSFPELDGWYEVGVLHPEQG